MNNIENIHDRMVKHIDEAISTENNEWIKAIYALEKINLNVENDVANNKYTCFDNAAEGVFTEIDNALKYVPLWFNFDPITHNIIVIAQFDEQSEKVQLDNDKINKIRNLSVHWSIEHCENICREHSITIINDKKDDSVLILYKVTDITYRNKSIIILNKELTLDELINLDLSHSGCSKYSVIESFSRVKDKYSPIYYNTKILETDSLEEAMSALAKHTNATPLRHLNKETTYNNYRDGITIRTSFELCNEGDYSIEWCIVPYDLHRLYDTWIDKEINLRDEEWPVDGSMCMIDDDD